MGLTNLTIYARMYPSINSYRVLYKMRSIGKSLWVKMVFTSFNSIKCKMANCAFNEYISFSRGVVITLVKFYQIYYVLYIGVL